MKKKNVRKENKYNIRKVETNKDKQTGKKIKKKERREKEDEYRILVKEIVIRQRD